MKIIKHRLKREKKIWKSWKPETGQLDGVCFSPPFLVECDSNQPLQFSFSPQFVLHRRLFPILNFDFQIFFILKSCIFVKKGMLIKIN